MSTLRQKRGSKKPSIPKRAFPEYEKLLDYRWRINQKPEVCVRDAAINHFLFGWEESGVRVRSLVYPKIKQIHGLDYGHALVFTELLTGYCFVLRFAPALKPGNDVGEYFPPVGPRSDSHGKNQRGTHKCKPIKTRIPGLKGDVRLAYQGLREWSDWLSPEPYRGKHLKTKIIRLMVKTLKDASWLQEEAFRVIADAFTCIGEPLTRIAVRKAFFRSRP